MMQRLVLLSTLFLFSLAPRCAAQPLLPITDDLNNIKDTKLKSLYFRVHNTTFFKNNEYFNEVIPGYTLPGLNFNPILTYYPTTNTKIEAGYQFKLLFGQLKRIDQEPYLRMQWNATPWFTLVVGNLYSHNTHQLSEPLISPEANILRFKDKGVQTLIHNKHLFADAWVSWEEFIWFGDTRNEEIFGGLSAHYQFQLGQSEITLPIGLTAYHSGGQIDVTNNPVYTQLNTTLGLRYKYHVNRWLKHLQASGQYFRFSSNQDDPNNPHLARQLPYRGIIPQLAGYPYQLQTNQNPLDAQFFTAGHAYLTRLTFNALHWTTALSYWYGYNFYSPRGEYIYHSLSPLGTGIKSERSFTHLHLSYQNTIAQGFQLSIGTDLYYHLGEQKLDFSTGIYLNFTREFFVSKIRSID